MLVILKWFLLNFFLPHIQGTLNCYCQSFCGRDIHPTVLCWPYRELASVTVKVCVGETFTQQSCVGHTGNLHRLLSKLCGRDIHPTVLCWPNRELASVTVKVCVGDHHPTVLCWPYRELTSVTVKVCVVTKVNQQQYSKQALKYSKTLLSHSSLG